MGYIKNGGEGGWDGYDQGSNSGELPAYHELNRDDHIWLQGIELHFAVEQSSRNVI